MSIIKIIGLSLLLLSSCLLLPAQNNYLVERFTTDNGLPSNGIKGLQWDQETGFLWIATEAGVTRYNGADFVTFSRANTPELFSERMLFLLKNRDGRIYTSDETGDLFFILRNKLQFVGQATVDTRPSTFRLTGLIASGRLFRQSSLQPPAGFGFNFSGELLLPLSENRILLTSNDTIYDYRTGRRNPAVLTTVGPGSKLFWLGGQVFVFDGRREFYRLDPDSVRKIPVPSTGLGEERPSGDSRQDKKTLFWDNGMKDPILVSGSQAWLLDYTGGKLVARSICTAIPTDALLSFAKYDDKNEILFLGTDSRGITVIRKNQVRPVKRPAASPETSAASYSQVALAGTAILNSQGDILKEGARPDGRTEPIPRSHIPFSNFVLTTPDSVLWYSQGDSIFSYSYRTRRTSIVPAGPGSITDGFALSGGNLYIANAIGVGVLQGNRIDYQYRYPLADINSNAPFAMLEISPGLLAIATCNGLFRYNTINHRVDTLLRMPGICVRALWKYKGYLFIGTYGRGIFLCRNGKIKPIPVDKNGYLQYAHCFIPDRLGFCWISSNKGLFRARPDDMTAAFDNDALSVYYHYYGRKDGMEITELNGGCTPCALQLNDTVLSFPAMDGLVWVDPTRPVSHLPEGQVYIDEFTADGQKINIGSLVTPGLPSNTRDMVFTLGFPAWADRENLRIQYRLEPYSKDWQVLDIEPNPKLHFSNLPPVSYRLILRKPNGFEAGNYSYTEYRFYIEPHWYQQLWSWLLCLCLFTALVIGIVRWRTRRFKIRQDRLERQIAEKTRELQAKNEELEKTDTIKTRLISIISHDLVTPLRFLHLTGKNLIERKDGLTEAMQQEAIAEIASTSKELELLSTNILNWIKYKNEDRRLAKESFNLHEMVDHLFGIFNAMSRQKQISLINQVDENGNLYQYIEPVKIVLYNLILNGINFTSEGYIRVGSSGNKDGISLLIEDTGVGMTQEQINNIMADHFIISSANVDNRKGNGLGYLIIKDLLKIIRGSLHIQSEKDKGSRVTVWVPL
jgi:signal transduction histidine kinase